LNETLADLPTAISTNDQWVVVAKRIAALFSGLNPTRSRCHLAFSKQVMKMLTCAVPTIGIYQAWPDTTLNRRIQEMDFYFGFPVMTLTID
jgi:hypothetical protein